MRRPPWLHRSAVAHLVREIIMVAEETRTRKTQNGGMGARSSEWVGENPLTSVTVLFGVGVGVGLLLGHTLAEAAGRHMIHQNTFTEKLTSQIRDALKNSLPAGLSRHLS